MANSNTPDTKICTNCGRELPATSEYFRKAKTTRDGFQSKCKDCIQEWNKAHYISFSELDLERRGNVGVKCPLYAPKCGKCIEVADCWRLEGFKPDSDGMPIKLQKLRKSSISLKAITEINQIGKAKKKSK